MLFYARFCRLTTLHWKELLQLQSLQVFLSVKIFFFLLFYCFRCTGTETSFKLSCSQYASNEGVKTQKVYNMHDKTYTCVKNATDLDKTIAWNDQIEGFAENVNTGLRADVSCIPFVALGKGKQRK